MAIILVEILTTKSLIFIQGWLAQLVQSKMDPIKTRLGWVSLGYGKVKVVKVKVRLRLVLVSVMLIRLV